MYINIFGRCRYTYRTCFDYHSWWIDPGHLVILFYNKSYCLWRLRCLMSWELSYSQITAAILLYWSSLIPCWLFVSKPGNLVLDGGHHQITVDNILYYMVPLYHYVVTIVWRLESDILKILNSLNVGLNGTTSLMYSLKSIFF